MGNMYDDAESGSDTASIVTQEATARGSQQVRDRGRVRVGKGRAVKIRGGASKKERGLCLRR
jgi:hypothetical protein